MDGMDDAGGSGMEEDHRRQDLQQIKKLAASIYFSKRYKWKLHRIGAGSGGGI